MHIVEIILHNYRGYAHSVIPVTPGLNVIYGEGDAGKSALEKALRWCLLNERQGKFVNKKILTPGKKIKSKEEVYVQTTFNTGEIIRRGANASTNNLYWIGDVNTPFEEWEAPIKTFTEIPPAVAEIVNMSSVNVGKQFDSHFLLSSKGGSIAKELNKMVDLEIIDTSLSNAKHFVNKVKKEKEASEFNLQTYKNDLEAYAFLEDMDKALSVVEELESNLDETKSSVTEIGSLLNVIEFVTNSRDKYVKILEYKSNIEAIQALKEKMESLSTKSEKVSRSLSILKENENALTKHKSVLTFKDIVESIEKVKKELDNTNDLYHNVETLLVRADVLKARAKWEAVTKWKDVVKSIASMEEQLALLNKEDAEISKLLDLIENNIKCKEEYEEEAIELKKNLKGVCPTCGRPFGKGETK